MLKSLYKKIFRPEVHLHVDLQELKYIAGQQLAIQQRRNLSTIDSLAAAEFKIFSQWGDDGIIQYLVNKLVDIPKSFIEFGVENYEEANTRFLL